MKQEVINGLSAAELQEKLSEAQKELANLKLNHAVSPLANPMEVRRARKTVARLMTETAKRQLQK